MPNLINTDNAGNVFYNYVTPITQGESTTGTNINARMLDGIFTEKLGVIGTSWNGSGSDTFLRFPALGLENKNQNISTADLTNARTQIRLDSGILYINTNNGSSLNRVNVRATLTGSTVSSPHKVFAVISDYAFSMAVFNSGLTVCSKFIYSGWCREPVFTGTNAPAGFVGLFFDNNGSGYARPLSVNTSAFSQIINLSTAANSITSPPIVCTPGTTPGVGSATFTDIVIRDAASPHNPVGKLWNCIDMPATCNVGELWKNTGAYDADGSTSNQDVYLCVMPWGERKLGMRVWTENVA